jgi:prepilin-type processing-associated H-X9-DG protein
MKLDGISARARKGGYVLYADGHSEVWERKSEGWGTWWRRARGEEREFEVVDVDNGTRKRGFFWLNTTSGRKNVNGNAERRPLLD